MVSRRILVMIGALARRGLPREAYDDWRLAVRAAGDPDEPVLAWARSVALDAEAGPVDGGPGVTIGTRGRLWVRQLDDGWRPIGWHRIDRGSWNGETRRLSWILDDGRRGEVTLTEPARLPDLFRERIAASVAVEETVRVGPGRTLTVSGRRDLSQPGSPLEWRTTLGRGLSWQQPGLAEQAELTVARLRAEYDRV